MKIEHPERKHLPHDVPPWVPDGAIFFITIKTIPPDVNQLCHDEMAKNLWASVKFNAERGVWWPHLFLLMPDHVHGLFSFAREAGLKQTVTAWKHFTAFKHGVRWQRDFFDHRLRSDESFAEKAHYIRQNPLRKGLIKEAESWPYVWAMDGRTGGMVSQR